MAQTRSEEKRDIWALRMTESEKAEIRARANEAEMSMTTYMIRAALGLLNVKPSTIDQHFAEIDDRLDKLERAAELGAFG